jgi:hypothetical protein
MANKFLRDVLTPSAATETTLYTVPSANAATVVSLRVTNRNANSTSLNVNVYPDGEATAYALLKSYVLPTNATMDVFSGVPLNMEQNDILKVTSSVATVDFVISYLEMDRS